MKKTFLDMSEVAAAQAGTGHGFFAVTTMAAVFCLRPASFRVRR
jgi:hypothetical protein